MMKRLLLVINPKSGRGDIVRKIYKVIEIFTRAEYEVTVYPTKAAGDACAYIKDRGSGFDLVVCAGGDGMINEAVNAYMHMENPPSLGYIPTGTTNDFAITLKLPREVIRSAYSILNGQPRLIDVGAFGEKYFSYVAAFGLFSKVPYTTDQNAKNILGRAAYILESVKHLSNIPAINCVIKVDDETIEGNFILGIVANATSVGGFRFNTEKGAVDDGLFEVMFMRPPKNLLELQEIVGMIQSSQINASFMIQKTAKRVEFSSDKPCDWTIDGESGGQHKNVVIKNLHRVLNIIMP